MTEPSPVDDGAPSRRGAVVATAAAAAVLLGRPAGARAATPPAADVINQARALHPLIGAWQVAITHPPGQPFPPGLPSEPGTLLFGADGSVTWSGLASGTGAGVWQPSGTSGFVYVFRAPLTRPDAAAPLGFDWVGFLHVKVSGTVSGNSYTGTGTGTQYDTAGVAGQVSQSTTVGVRVTVAGG